MTKIDLFRGEFYFLSNFYYSTIVYKGKEYKSAEHAYQAAKAITEKDEKLVREARSAGEAKRLGRIIDKKRNFESQKISIMREILEIKFSDQELKELLLLTKGFFLEEGNTWGDVFWGTVDGKGENWLGKILMEIRDKQ